MNDSKSDKLRKVIIKEIVLLITMSMVLSGCYEKYDVDYMGLYGQYLKYSLGEYKIKNKQTKKWSAGVVPGSGEMIAWELEYVNDRKEVKLFKFANHGYSDGGNDANFGYAVLTHALEIGREQLVNDLIKRYFKDDEIGVTQYNTNNSKTSAFVTASYNYVTNKDITKENQWKKYEKCKSSKKGIQLRSITPKDMVMNWECNFGFEVNTKVEDENQLNELKKKIEKLMLEFIEYIDDYNTVVELNGKDYKHSYRAIYNKENDSITWKSLDDIYEAQKYKDGHLINVNEIIVNGKSLSQYDLAFYSFETNEYHITDYLRFLRELGCDVQMTDKYGVYRWRVGMDMFESSNLGKKWYVKKNGKGNLLKYSAYKNKGISLSDFELMTNSTAYFDKDKKAIIINAKN